MILFLFGCSNVIPPIESPTIESPSIEILKNSFFETVENSMKSRMDCGECDGLYNFKKGQIYKSNDSIYYFIIDHVTGWPYTLQDKFFFNIKSFSKIYSDENLFNVYQKNKLVTEVSNTEFYNYLITKNYPNDAAYDNILNMINTLNQSSSKDELKEKESWLNSSLSFNESMRGLTEENPVEVEARESGLNYLTLLGNRIQVNLKKDIYEFVSIDYDMGDFELIVKDLLTGKLKYFIFPVWGFEEQEFKDILYLNQFEKLNAFENETFDIIRNSEYSSLIINESPPSDVFKFDFVPIKIKVLYSDDSPSFYDHAFFVQRVKHNPVVTPKNLSFQEIKNNWNYEKDFQTEIEGKTLYSLFYSTPCGIPCGAGGSDYGTILWFNDKNNLSPFFSYSHNLSEVKTLWKELYD